MGKGLVRAEDLHRVLDAEVRKLRTGSGWTRLLDAATLLPTFGFENLVLINLQMPQASWVAHALTWKKLGRRVRTEHAIRILRPARSRTAGKGTLEAIGQKYGADDLVEQQVTGFRVGAVYDVTATDGPPIHLPRPPILADSTVARALWDGLAREGAADGFAVDVRPTGDGSEGFTDHSANRIVIADHLDDFHALRRLAHEVGHMRLHSATALENPATARCRGMTQVEAESVAYIVLAHHGMSVEAKSFEHIEAWAKLVDPKAPANVITATGARVVNTARLLIDSTDKYLKAHRITVDPARAPLDSALLTPDLDGPML